MSDSRLQIPSIVLAATAVLSACGGGGGGNGSGSTPTPSPVPTSSPAPTPSVTVCQTIGTGNAAVQVAVGNDCTNCAVGDADSVIDGDLASAAVLSTPLSGTITIRGTAQPGVVFPAGLSAGVFVEKPSSTADGSFRLTVRTFLEGAEVDSQVVYARAGGTETAVGRSVFTDDGDYYGISSASGPFDAVELELARTAVVSGSDFSVFELCTSD